MTTFLSTMFYNKETKNNKRHLIATQLFKNWIFKLIFLLSIITIISGLAITGISCQMQLQSLKNVPNQLETTLKVALQGDDAPFYKIFIIGLDAKILFTDEQATNKVINPNSKKTNFDELKSVAASYFVKTKPFSTEQEEAYKIGQNTWAKFKNQLLAQHLTFDAHNGLSYFFKSITHGNSLATLLKTKASKTVIIDEVFKQILTEMHNIAAYNSVNAIKLDTQKQKLMPKAPEIFTVYATTIFGIKIGAVMLLIISPILISVLILSTLSFLIYNHFKLRRQKKVEKN